MILKAPSSKNKLKGKFKRESDGYIPLLKKLKIAHSGALIWLLLSIYLSLNWVHELSLIVTLPVALFIIGGIAYIPGYINAFNVISLLLDRQPKFKVSNPTVPITILIACYNEEKNIRTTLQYIYKQFYLGEIKVIVIDNNSTDRTAEYAQQFAKKFKMDIRVIHESKKGKHHALNSALKLVDTPYTIILDADTILMPGSLRYIVSRQLTAPDDVVATAGAILVRNGRKNFWTKLQEWEYFLGIASVKRMQGMYQGTLVAQGAFSIFRTKNLVDIGGFPDVIGEDIVVTWLLLGKGYKVYFEPLAVAFTDVPETFKHFQRQRSRWARGMIEALKQIKPWQQPNRFPRYATFLNLLMPYIDIVYSLAWIPGLILAFFGITWIAGPMTLLVLPLALLQSYILYKYQKNVFKHLNLRIRKNKMGFILYVLTYQFILSPISLYGYIEEVFKLKRVWK